MLYLFRTYLPSIIYLSVAIFLFFALRQKHNNFFDMRGIWNNHWSIFNNDIKAIFTFGVVPYLLALATLLSRTLDSSDIDNLIIVLSILISMFLTLLGVLYGTSFDKFQNQPTNSKSQEEQSTQEKIQKQEQKLQSIKKLVKQTIDTILFECSVAIILLLLLFSLSFIGLPAGFLLCLFSFVVYFLSFLLIFNMFILLKRISVIVQEILL